MKLHFMKMCATGNDFIIVDNREGRMNPGDSELIRRLCTRRMSVGADGLILLGDDDELDFSMEYFNSDGLEASMCGNGGRCIALFAHKLGIAGKDIKFRSAAGVHSASLSSVREYSADVALSMTDPTGLLPENTLDLGDETVEYGMVDTGVPHVVLLVDDLGSLDVRSRGRSIRQHERFRKVGTNVDFIQLRGDNYIQVRTYERGVENETLSCGTGAVASALMTAVWTGAAGPIRVDTASGESLTVSFEGEGERFCNVILEGEARIVYYGVMAAI